MMGTIHLGEFGETHCREGRACPRVSSGLFQSLPSWRLSGERKLEGRLIPAGRLAGAGNA
jgi:hypothetical protein